MRGAGGKEREWEVGCSQPASTTSSPAGAPVPALQGPAGQARFGGGDTPHPGWHGVLGLTEVGSGAPHLNCIHTQALN